MTEQNPNDMDRMLEATVRTRLAAAPGLGNVVATVASGMVTLTGNVGEELDIKRAVIIAKTVEGVQDINEELQVVGADLDQREAYINPLEGVSSSTPSAEAAVGISPLDEDLNPTMADEGGLASLIKEGMDVFDSEGKKVGKVKEVRASDFLLSRLLARNYYVPYIVCSMNTDGIHLNVKGSEINDQGWAYPHSGT